MKIHRTNIQVNDLIFDCRVAGNNNHPLVILLHGWPESAFMWVNVMQDIAKLGFYCVAPNLRGYSSGALLKGKKHYTIDKLSEDVKNISKAIGKQNFHLIGHDWGAVIGWKVVHDHSELILSWTALSVPHIQAFGYAIKNDPIQKKKSRYIKHFQTPFLPEMKLRKNDFEMLRKLWKYSSKEEVEDYLSIFKNKAALTASINYYRANARVFADGLIGDITVPTLFIWGEHDVAIGAVGVERGHQYMKGYYRFVKLDAGHWLIQTKYSHVKEEICNHLLKFKA
ncbi:alpha/beta fold hydrolase [Hwangdonia lutea]|uniref:Alpha/beta hydrolase n=1 Tax=Hwangdonia lutea TaxID=3075823 RepID=A0AA97HP30_9FLAO|nr:alpha/beta hydrolase [Hwangdonia sp. SCSIO 19198]WOD42631.1 alpha/beta hydrolase [Hwangdonia sp. SCSIO 19198]